MIYMRCPECGKRRIFHVDSQNQIYIDCPKDGIFLRHYDQKPANWTPPKRKRHLRTILRYPPCKGDNEVKRIERLDDLLTDQPPNARKRVSRFLLGMLVLACAACGVDSRSSATIASGTTPQSYTQRALRDARASLAANPCHLPHHDWECGILIAQGKGDIGTHNWDWVGVVVENSGNVVVIGNSYEGDWNAKAIEIAVIDGTRIAWDNHDHDEIVGFPKEFVQLP